MTSILSTHRRVSRRSPCPICGKAEWCLVSLDGATAVCPRTLSERPVSAPSGDFVGYRHTVDGAVPRVTSKAWVAPKPTIDFQTMFDDLWANESSAALDAAAQALGLSCDALSEYGGVWAPARRALLWPMYDDAGAAIGARTRTPDGAKLSLTGSHNGLFLPTAIRAKQRPARLLICEGPTTAGALFDLGFTAIGRPSCSGGGPMLRAIVARLGIRDVVIVADRDRLGAEAHSWPAAVRLANALAALVAVRIIRPPHHKDARDWKAAGATRGAVECVISNTEVHTVEKA